VLPSSDAARSGHRFRWRFPALENCRKKAGHTFLRNINVPLLSAFLSGVILLTGSFFIIIEAVQRLLDPQPSDARGMLIFALVGMGVNGYAAFRTSRGKNMNSRMISWHMIEDLLGWAAVFVVSIVLMVKQINILDPLLSLFVTAFVLYNVLKNLRKTLRLFLQGVPDTFNVKDVEAEIRSLDKEESPHAHLVSGCAARFTTNVVLCWMRKRKYPNIKTRARIDHRYNLAHTTVEFEYLDEDCSMRNNGHMHSDEVEEQAHERPKK